jgi:signal transduction histidine kinase
VTPRAGPETYGDRVRIKVVLVLAAVLVVVVGSADLLQHYDVPATLALPLSLLRILPWALLPRDPRVAWGGTLVATYLTAAAGDPVGPGEPWPWAVTSILAALPVAVVCGARLSRPVVAALAASVPVTGAVALLIGGGDWTDLVAPAVLLGIGFAAGDLVRGRREARAGLTVERDRREALEERARIAREMHDVVAHGLALVTVRADSAPARLAGVSPDVAAEFAGIADAARTTLTELRGLLEVLRGPGAELAPQPGLADLEELAASSRAAGVPVRLTVSGDLDLPPGVQLAAYRLVQEALSNVLRHAPGAPADVSVSRGAEALLVTVTNPGPAGPAGRGHGLVGMRERVAAVGGTVSAGPEPGGWRVAARLPT